MVSRDNPNHKKGTDLNSSTSPFSFSHRKETLLGVALAAPTIIIALIIPKVYALDSFALLLAFIAAVYLGFALVDGRMKQLMIEITFIVFIVSLAALGLWVSPYFFVAGYFAHGAWDILHHPKGIQTKLVSWWPPFCLVYDWIIAVFLMWWLI